MTLDEKLQNLQKETFTVADLDLFIEIMKKGKVDLLPRFTERDSTVRIESFLKELAINRISDLLLVLKNHIEQ